MERWKLSWFEKVLLYGGWALLIGVPTLLAELGMFAIFGQTTVTIIIGCAGAMLAGIVYVASILGLLLWTE